MRAGTAVDVQPAWLLHRYPYRETSLVLEVLTRDHGRIGVVARGGRRPRRGAPPLAPFVPLRLSFRRRGELATLTGIETAQRGPELELRGRAFLAACYLNELVLRLLPRDDPAPEVYALYADALDGVVTASAVTVRRFEGRLLRVLGWMPRPDRDAGGVPVTPARRYRYDPQRGPLPVADGGIGGEMLAAVAAERFDEPAVLAAAGRVFGDVIAYHLGGRPLKSLEVARAMARGAAAKELR